MKSGETGAKTRRHQLGFSLIEAAVALSIVGLAATGLWQAMGGMWARESVSRAQSHMARAEAAVQSFAGIHGRLPCPATAGDGLEVCVPSDAIFLLGSFPYATVGVPESEMARLTYRVRSDTLRLPPLVVTTPPADEPFQVLANNQPIGLQTIELAMGPEATRQNLSAWVANTYDGMLDLCAVLSTKTAPGVGPRPAFEIELAADDRLLVSIGKVVQRKVVSAAQISSHLGCGPMVAVSGRGQYNAHLSGAVMAKAAQDFRAQLELSYATYVLEVVEGAWNVSNNHYRLLVAQVDFIQAVSAVHAKAWEGTELITALATLTTSMTTHLLRFVSWGARVSNLARFSNNLKNYRDHLRIANGLVEDSLSNYALATRHARLGSTSAYFLREQTEVPVLPPQPGPASDYGLNARAQGVLSTAQGIAQQALGQAGEFTAHVSMPAGTEPQESVVDDGILDYKTMVKKADGAPVPPPSVPGTGATKPVVDAIALERQSKEHTDDAIAQERQSKERSTEASDLGQKVNDAMDPNLQSDTFKRDELDAKDFDAEKYDPKAYDPNKFNPDAFDRDSHNWEAMQRLLDKPAPWQDAKE